MSTRTSTARLRDGLAGSAARAARAMRAHPRTTVVIGCIAEIAVFAPFAFVTPDEAVGTRGLLATVIALAVALGAGAAPGAVVAFVGGLANAVVPEIRHDAPASVLVALPLLVVAAVVAGLVAERLRVEAANALAAEADARAALGQLVESNPAIYGGGLDETQTAICLAACEALGCAESLLLRQEEPAPVLLARVSPDGRAAALPPPSAVAPGRSASMALTDAGLWLLQPIELDGEADYLLALRWPEGQEGRATRAVGVARRLADQAAVAVQQARRREAQDDAAALHARLEAGLLAVPSIRESSFRVVTRYEPGEARLLLGGDFYDAVDLPDGTLAVMVGDVSGHGPDAAALGANLRAGWRALTLGGSAADAIVRALGEVVDRERASPEFFATLCCGSIDLSRGVFTYVAAGHPAPLLLGDDVVPLEDADGPPLGVGGALTWAVREVELPRQWALLLYSDGLVEGRARPRVDTRLGVDGLIARIRAQHDVSANLDEAGLDRVLASVRAANGGGLDDDVAVLLVRPLAQEARGSASVRSAVS